jgi:hypothetical protein
MANAVREQSRTRSPNGRPPGAADKHRLGYMLFLVAAGISFLLSIALWFAGDHDEGLFVGIWVPSILAAGAFWATTVARRP